MKLFIISISALLFFWLATPALWKGVGGSFIHGSTVIYKGKQLFYPSDKCAISVTGEDFHEVKQVCLIDGTTLIRTWINGVEIINTKIGEKD